MEKFSIIIHSCSKHYRGRAKTRYNSTWKRPGPTGRIFRKLAHNLVPQGTVIFQHTLNLLDEHFQSSTSKSTTFLISRKINNGTIYHFSLNLLRLQASKCNFSDWHRHLWSMYRTLCIRWTKKKITTKMLFCLIRNHWWSKQFWNISTSW